MIEVICYIAFVLWIISTIMQSKTIKQQQKLIEIQDNFIKGLELKSRMQNTLLTAYRREVEVAVQGKKEQCKRQVVNNENQFL